MRNERRETSPEERAAKRARDFRLFALHRLAYILIVGVALAVNVLTFSGTLWIFWPAGAWGLVLLVHFLIVRSIHVQDEWVDERVADLRMNSYDFDHIHNIQDRFTDGSLDKAPSQKDVER